MGLTLRKDIDDAYKWDLSAIITDDEKWEELLIETESKLKNICDYKGKLNNIQDVADCLKLDDGIGMDIERLCVYARMKMDEDSTVSVYQDFSDRAERLAVQASTLNSYIVPELTLLPTDELLAFADTDLLKEYSYLLKNIARSKEHILSEKEELILSETASFSDGFHDVFNMLDNADINFGKVNFEGQTMSLTHGSYSVVMQSADRKARKKAFEKMFGAYKNLINTLAINYAGNVKKNCFYARVRKYKSALDKAMFQENVPTNIYYNLVESVNNALPILHEYISLRKKALDYDKYFMWDMYTSIIDGVNRQTDYADAIVQVKSALKPLGADYAELLERAFNEKWIDVYENKGKRSGAYSWGTYSAHPYVLLNYSGTSHDVFTIAHELGHAMHSYYSNTTQPYAKAGYEIFVAEIASTVNEVLLLKNKISTAQGGEKKYLLSYYLDMFRTTLFRQTQFAEFEMVAHQAYEEGKSLTSEFLSSEYEKLNAKYYGENVEKDDYIKYEWARIPHFYRSFYVYKYATGITSAVVIANKILTQDGYVEKYKKFLSLGGSMPPNEILKVADVDLENKETFDIAMKEFKNTLEELSRLI